MDVIWSLEFLFQEKTFFALVRVKHCESETLYHFTVMNGDLERTLFGHHIIAERNGQLDPGPSCNNKKVMELKDCVLAALRSKLGLCEPGSTKNRAGKSQDVYLMKS